MNRHQFHAIHAQLLQIRNLFGYAGKGPGMLYIRIRTACKITDMHFIDDQFIYRSFQRKVVFPIKVITNHTGTVLVYIVPIGLGTPYVTSCNQLGIRVHQDFRLIKTMTFLRIPWPVHPITIFDILEIQIEDHHREYISHLEFLQERYFDKRFRFMIMEKNQRTSRSVTGIDRKIDGISHYRSSKRIRTPCTQFQSFIFMRRK